MVRSLVEKGRLAAFPDLVPGEVEFREEVFRNDAESDTDKEDAEDEKSAGGRSDSSINSIDVQLELYSYDPNLVSDQDLAWLVSIRCIGFNPDVGKLSLPTLVLS